MTYYKKKKLGFKQTLRGLIDQYFDPCRYYEVASEELLVVYTEMDKNNIVGKLKHKTRLKVNQRHRQQIHLVEPLIGWVDLRSESQEVLCALLDRADILMEQVNDMSKKVEELETKLENATSSLEHKEKKEKSSLAEHNEMRDLENILDKKEEECEVLEMEVQKLKKQVKILSDETEHNEILNKLNKANKKLEDVNNTLINLHNTTVTGNEVKRKEELKPVAEQNNYGGEAIDFDNNISEEAEKLKEEVSILQTQIAKQADAIAIKEQMMDQVKDSLSGLGFKELNFDSANSIPKLRAQLTILTKQIQGFRKKQELLED